MNRSFSKIRHIQEANRILEKRLLLEQTTVDELVSAFVTEINQSDPDDDRLLGYFEQLENFTKANEFLKKLYKRIDRVTLGKKINDVIRTDRLNQVLKKMNFTAQVGQGNENQNITWIRGINDPIIWDRKTLYTCVWNHPDFAKNRDKYTYLGGIAISGITYYASGRYFNSKTGDKGTYGCNPTTGGIFLGQSDSKVDLTQPKKEDKGGKITDKSLGTGNKISQELQSGAKSRPGDPYQYMIGSDNQWYFKSYLNRGKQVTDWKLVTNADSIKTLDSEFPGRSTGVTTNQPSQPVVDVNNITIPQIEKFINDNPEFADSSIDKIKAAIASKGLA